MVTMVLLKKHGYEPRRQRLVFLHAYVHELVPLPLFNHPDYFLIGLRGPGWYVR